MYHSMYCIHGYIFVCKYIYIHTYLMCARVYVYIKLMLTGWAIVPADFSTQRCIPNPTHKRTHAHNPNTRTRTHTFSRTPTHPHTPTHTFTRTHTRTHKLNRIFLYFHVSKNAQSALANKIALDFLCKKRPMFSSLVCDMFMCAYVYIYIHIHILSIFLGTRLPISAPLTANIQTLYPKSWAQTPTPHPKFSYPKPYTLKIKPTSSHLWPAHLLHAHVRFSFFPLFFPAPQISRQNYPSRLLNNHTSDLQTFFMQMWFFPLFLSDYTSL